MKYIRYALFRTSGEAQAALQDVQAAAVPGEKVVLVFRPEVTQDDKRGSESDGKHGVLVGAVSGLVVGLLFGLVLAWLHILPLPYSNAAVFGLLLGGLLGSIGAGLFGAGLTALSLQGLQRRWKVGNVLATAETEDALTVLQIEHIFKKHHALMAAS